MVRTLVLLALGAALLVLDPFYACGTSFGYGAGELRAAVEGTWRLTVPAHRDSPAREITIAIAQGTHDVELHSQRQGVVPVAAACGTRSLIRSAGACMDVSKMPIDVTVIAGATGASAGELNVYGTSFNSGELEIRIADETLHARISPAGTASGVLLSDAPGTLVRIATR